MADVEPSSVYGFQENIPIRTILFLAFQSFGVVYGELSTSPLYVFRSTFSGRLSLHESDDEILGVLSFILYTLTIIPLIKYVFIVLSASDNGEGGTFALYSLLCRHAKLSLLPNQQDADLQLSTYNVEIRQQTTGGLRVKNFFEKFEWARKGLLVVVLLGTCMVIADGVFTPAMSVLSAVAGIKVAVPNLPEGVVTGVSCGILAGLFALQHRGTRRVAFFFAPIVLLWLFCISSIGVYNIVVYNPQGIWAAFNPVYMYKFLKLAGKDGWVSLGSVVLCITGHRNYFCWYVYYRTEAMFANLGHFNQLSIQIAFATLVYPSLMLGYIGQAAYLTKNRNDVSESFYKSIPTPVFWPVLVIASLAAIVGSQAVISATFSIIKQCVSLCCFPRVKVIHTSQRIHGQIYIPEINWILFVLCMAVTIGFSNTITIGNAYGLAVITVMLVTTLLMALVILIVRGRHLIEALGFLLIFGSIEALFISASFMKFPQGGWVPLLLTSVFMIIMFIWNYGSSKKYEAMDSRIKWELMVSLNALDESVRVPGIGLYYTEFATDGVPLLFSTFHTHLPALHTYVVLVTIKSVPVPYIPPYERNLFSRIGRKCYRLFRCTVRYGYKDIHKADVRFEEMLLADLRVFILTEDDEEASTDEGEDDVEMTPLIPTILSRSSVHPVENDSDIEMREMKGKEPLVEVSESNDSEHPSHATGTRRVRFETSELQDQLPVANCLRRRRMELRKLDEEQSKGVVYILGHSYVKASDTSSRAKRFAINYVYNFLRRICRGPSVELHIPPAYSIEIGVIYNV